MDLTLLGKVKRMSLRLRCDSLCAWTSRRRALRKQEEVERGDAEGESAVGPWSCDTIFRLRLLLSLSLQGLRCYRACCPSPTPALNACFQLPLTAMDVHSMLTTSE